MFTTDFFSILFFIIFIGVYLYIRRNIIPKNNLKEESSALPEDHGVLLAQFSSLDAFDDSKIIEIQSFLAERDIDSLYETYVGGDLIQNYHLLVRRGDLEQAQDILKEYFKKN